MEFLEIKNINKSISFIACKCKSKKSKEYYGLFAKVDDYYILLTFINKTQYDKIK